MINPLHWPRALVMAWMRWRFQPLLRLHYRLNQHSRRIKALSRQLDTDRVQWKGKKWSELKSVEQLAKTALVEAEKVRAARAGDRAELEEWKRSARKAMLILLENAPHGIQSESPTAHFLKSFLAEDEDDS